jgi:DNA-binding phage protein
VRRWTKGEDAQLASMIEAGQSRQYAAEALNRTVDSVRRRAEDRGTPFKVDGRSFQNISDKVEPLVRFVLEEIDRQGLNLNEVAKKSGVDKNTMYHWQYEKEPRLKTLKAVAEAIGYEFVLEKFE